MKLDIPMNIIIEQDVPEPGALQRIMYAALELNCSVTVVDRVNEIPISSSPFVFFGCIEGVKQVQLNSHAIIWANWDDLACHSYYAYYGPYLTQKEYGFYPFQEIIRLKDFLYKTYGENNRIFIRPDSNDKAFTGEVVEEPRLNHWLKAYEPKPNLLCVVSKPIKIHAEYRFIVVDSKVITGSQYKIGGMIQSEPCMDQRLIDFAEKLASIWQPHPVFVMDIAQERDTNNLSLMEIGSINAAGFYKCDVKAIVKAILENI